MRITVVFEESDVLDKDMEEDEIKFAKKYIGNYVLRTMSFGEKNEAQYKAVDMNVSMPNMSKIDAWKFRFYSLLYSLEEVPTVGKRRKNWSDIKMKELEKFIYDAPATVGEKLLVVSDKVNRMTELEEKNLE